MAKLRIMPAQTNTALLRRDKRDKRRSLTADQQKQHACLMAYHLIHHPRFLNCRRIACYLPNDGEIDPIHIIGRAWAQNKQIYLPVLSPLGNSLLFAPFMPGTEMSLNKFGILEPTCEKKYWLKPRQIDLMLLPLVAFDITGNRLGMGGGFYDRSLAHLKHREHARKPYIMGLAHECQKTEKISAQSWDIPLDAIVTEKQIYKK
jgi:5-formyltetrahydrofolate cyclo-ligase